MSNFFGKKRFHLSSPAANLMPDLTSTPRYNDKYSSKNTSSPSSTPSSSPSENGEFFSSQSMKNLTKHNQHKLRHLTAEEFCLPVEGDRHVLPVSPNSESKSPHGLLQHWSLSAVPQPLPLPGDELRFPAKACSQEDRGGGSHRREMNSKNHGDSMSSKPSTYHRRKGYLQDVNGKNVGGSIRLDVSARSCPSTTFTSPTLSPQRFSTVDVLDSAFAFPQELHSSETSNNRSQLNSKGPSSHAFVRSLNNKSPQEARPLPLPPSRLVSGRQSLDKPDGQSIKGRWQKGKLIGRGAYGSVFEAINRETGSLCAMKEVDIVPDDTKSAECIRQLEQEIMVLRNLDHPNIVKYLGYELVEDRFCIYLEYVHPGSINKYIRDHLGAITESVVRNFTRHVLSGLAYLHSKKTVHRDIKGANLLVDASGVVKLADFGLAKYLIPHGYDLSLKGSPHWMAPEVLQAVMRRDSNPEHTFTMDIWSLGCTVIEMVTGKPPWSEFNAVQAMFNVLNRSPPIPEALSSEGKDFLSRCLQRNPKDRSSAAMLLEHPFVCNSFNHGVSLCNQEFSGLRLKDISYNPSARQKDTPVKHGWLQFRRGTPKHQPAETTKDHSAGSHHSTRSAPEVVPNLSRHELNHFPMTVDRGRTYSLPTTPRRETYRF